MKDAGKDDTIYIQDILHETANIQNFVKGLDKEGFLKNELVRRAVERSIQIIGEAARGVSQKFRGRHPEIEWRNIVAMRNFITHAYGEVDYAMVWEVAQRDVPALESKLKEIAKKGKI